MKFTYVEIFCDVTTSYCKLKVYERIIFEYLRYRESIFKKTLTIIEYEPDKSRIL